MNQESPDKRLEVQLKVIFNEKIISLDIDDMLYNDNKKITDKTKEALLKMQENGHIICLASKSN